MDELEFIHIDLEAYYPGSFLSTENNNYHYSEYNNVKYAEMFDFNNRQGIEATILKAIEDKNLDNYNRLNFALLFADYCFNDPANGNKQTNIHRLTNAVKDFPSCIKFNCTTYQKSKEEN